MSVTRILALDASSRACSVAVWSGTVDGCGEVVHRFEIAPRQQTQKLLPMVDEVLSEAGITLDNLDALSFGHGPGSFTGLRVAAGVAQGLAFGAGKPLMGISTLAALALRAHQQHGAKRVLAALDARMSEVYTASFEIVQDNQWEMAVALDEERVVSPATLLLPDGEFFGCGAGLGYLEQFPADTRARVTDIDVDAEPDARSLVQLAARAYFNDEAKAPAQIQPIYLRDNVVTRSKRGPLE